VQQTLSIAIVMAFNPKSKQNLQPAQRKYGHGIATKAIRVPELLVPKILDFVDQQINGSNEEVNQVQKKSDPVKTQINLNSIKASENAESSELEIKNDSLPSISIILFQHSEVHESTISSIQIDQISISFQGLP
jgi:hypothetical protein